MSDYIITGLTSNSTDAQFQERTSTLQANTYLKAEKVLKEKQTD